MKFMKDNRESKKKKKKQRGEKKISDGISREKK